VACERIEAFARARVIPLTVNLAPPCFNGNLGSARESAALDGSLFAGPKHRMVNDCEAAVFARARSSGIVGIL
jgi:hypothetical protein